LSNNVNKYPEQNDPQSQEISDISQEITPNLAIRIWNAWKLWKSWQQLTFILLITCVVMFIVFRIVSSLLTGGGLRGVVRVNDLVYNSIFTGSIYMMMGIGLTLVYRILKFANFAHAEYILFGGFTAFFVNFAIFSKIASIVLKFLNLSLVFKCVQSKFLTLSGLKYTIESKSRKGEEAFLFSPTFPQKFKCQRRTQKF